MFRPQTVSNCRANLLQAIEWEEFTRDEILDRLNNLKRQRLEDEAKLTDLVKTRSNLTSLANADIKPGKLYDRVFENLQNANLELKRLTLAALWN